jgi:hypothetical protein
MKLTKNTIRKLIKEELSLIKEAEITIPDKVGLKREYAQIRSAYEAIEDGDAGINLKQLAKQLNDAKQEYKQEIIDVMKVAAQLDNWRRLAANTHDLFFYVTRGGKAGGLNFPKFREMSDKPLGEEGEDLSTRKK